MTLWLNSSTYVLFVELHDGSHLSLKLREKFKQKCSPAYLRNHTCNTVTNNGLHQHYHNNKNHPKLWKKYIQPLYLLLLFVYYFT